VLSVEQLGFGYSGQTPILKDVSFTVNDGEIIALVGASGCGKSTLLRLISGLLPLQQGLLNWKTSPKCSFVFQEPALMPWANVEKNVLLPLTIREQEDSVSVAEVLKKTGLAGYETRLPLQLSGGQKMRVSIARAIIAKPDLLLLDEPFAALDEILRFKMNELLLSLRTDMHLSALFVTHSIYEACYLADRVLVMAKGRVVGEVKPKLDRNIAAEEQRTSTSFLNAAKTVSALLSEVEA